MFSTGSKFEGFDGKPPKCFPKPLSQEIGGQTAGSAHSIATIHPEPERRGLAQEQRITKRIHVLPWSHWLQLASQRYSTQKSSWHPRDRKQCERVACFYFRGFFFFYLPPQQSFVFNSSLFLLTRNNVNFSIPNWYQVLHKFFVDATVPSCSTIPTSAQREGLRGARKWGRHFSVTWPTQESHRPTGDRTMARGADGSQKPPQCPLQFPVWFGVFVKQ